MRLTLRVRGVDLKLHRRWWVDGVVRVCHRKTSIKQLGVHTRGLEAGLSDGMVLRHKVELDVVPNCRIDCVRRIDKTCSSPDHDLATVNLRDMLSRGNLAHLVGLWSHP